MTVERLRVTGDDTADFLIHCDEKGCKNSLDAKDRMFMQAVNLMKAKGWRMYKNYGTWQHTCPKCISGEDDADNG